MSKFSIKKLKFNETMSEETPCFSADLYEDGKLVAHISNRGHGGGNEIQPADGLTYADVAHIDNLDTECEINTIVEELNIVQKDQSKSLVLKKGGKIYTQLYKNSFAKMKKSMGAEKFNKFVKETVAKHKASGYEVLNTNLGL